MPLVGEALAAFFAIQKAKAEGVSAIMLEGILQEMIGSAKTYAQAIVLAYRRAVFKEFDETYAQAFGNKPY